MTKKTHEFVTFLNAAGEEVSNDPLWLAKKQLDEAGVEGYQAPEFDIPGDYDHLEGPELKALAKERKISTVGFKKASQFREALEAWDEAHDDEDDDKTEGDESGNDKSAKGSSDSGDE